MNRNNIDFLHRMYLESFGEYDSYLNDILKSPINELTDYQKSLLSATLNVKSSKGTLLESIDKFLSNKNNHLRVLGLPDNSSSVEGFVLYTQKNGTITNLSIFIDNDNEKPVSNLLVSAYLKTFFVCRTFDSATWRVSVFHPFKDAYKDICGMFQGFFEENEEFITFTMNNIFKGIEVNSELTNNL